MSLGSMVNITDLSSKTEFGWPKRGRKVNLNPVEKPKDSVEELLKGVNNIVRRFDANKYETAEKFAERCIASFKNFLVHKNKGFQNFLELDKAAKKEYERLIRCAGRYFKGWYNYEKFIKYFDDKIAKRILNIVSSDITAEVKSRQLDDFFAKHIMTKKNIAKLGEKGVKAINGALSGIKANLVSGKIAENAVESFKPLITGIRAALLESRKSFYLNPFNAFSKALKLQSPKIVGYLRTYVPPESFARVVHKLSSERATRSAVKYAAEEMLYDAEGTLFKKSGSAAPKPANGGMMVGRSSSARWIKTPRGTGVPWLDVILTGFLMYGIANASEEEEEALKYSPEKAGKFKDFEDFSSFRAFIIVNFGKEFLGKYPAHGDFFDAYLFLFRHSEDNDARYKMGYGKYKPSYTSFDNRYLMKIYIANKGKININRIVEAYDWLKILKIFNNKLATLPFDKNIDGYCEDFNNFKSRARKEVANISQGVKRKFYVETLEDIAQEYLLNKENNPGFSARYTSFENYLNSL